jgi:hypothetical protein
MHTIKVNQVSVSGEAVSVDGYYQLVFDIDDIESVDPNVALCPQ